MTRPLESFPRDILHVLTVLAGSLEQVTVAGSAASNRQYWPTDIKCGSDSSDPPGAARWTPKDVLAGSVSLKDGKTELLLAAACADKTALCKVDAVAYLPSQQKFVDFSCIFMFHKNIETRSSRKMLRSKRRGKLAQSRKTLAIDRCN